MSETKFTPGPWSVGVWEGSVGRFRGTMAAVFYPGGMIAPTGLIEGDPESAPNARLIAAAPDLYAALEQIASLTPMRANSITAGDHHRKVKRMAEEALDKVRGK